MNNTFILTNTSTFEMAVKAIDDGGLGFVAVVDNTNLLIGILTDGDIRRAFLRKTYDLQLIINKNPEIMSEKCTKQELIARLKFLHRRHMPLVDENMHFKGVFSLDDIEFVARKNPVVIMAGGLGSRLGELTKEIPKPMLTVGNQPMLQHLVELFREQGFRKFIFCVNYKKEVIRDYFLDGSKFGVKIDYIEENKRLGTAGALSLIQPEIKVPFFVINADILTNLNFVDLLEFHKEKQSAATMCVRQYKLQVPYGVINSNEHNELISIEEKPQLKLDVNAGIYLLEPSVQKFIPKDEYFDMPSLFEKIMFQNETSSVYLVKDYWLDIGRIDDLKKANSDMQAVELQ